MRIHTPTLAVLLCACGAPPALLRPGMSRVEVLATIDRYPVRIAQMSAPDGRRAEVLDFRRYTDAGLPERVYRLVFIEDRLEYWGPAKRASAVIAELRLRTTVEERAAPR